MRLGSILAQAGDAVLLIPVSYTHLHKEDMSRRREFIIFSVLSAIGLGLNDLYMFIGVGLLNVGTCLLYTSQLGLDDAIRSDEIAHIVKGVLDLLGAQGTPRPVRQRFGLGQGDAACLLYTSLRPRFAADPPRHRDRAA